jgi:hypothetical protein
VGPIYNILYKYLVAIAVGIGIEFGVKFVLVDFGCTSQWLEIFNGIYN